MKKLIKVSDFNIKIGKKRSMFCCPVALALRQQIISEWASVGFISIRIGTDEYHRITMKTPRSVSRFIKRFDNEKSVKPFNFYLAYEDQKLEQ